MGHGGHKFDPARRGTLDSPARRAYLDPEGTLRAFGLREGMIMADVGAGTGFFALPAARLVGPRGRVYAFDLAPSMLEDLRQKVRESGTGNVVVLHSLEDRLPLPDASVDFAFIACVLHELVGPGTLRECRRILRPSGSLGVVDWKKIDQDEGPPKEHRFEEAEARAVLESAGFRPARTFEAGPYHYGIEGRLP